MFVGLESLKLQFIPHNAKNLFFFSYPREYSFVSAPSIRKSSESSPLHINVYRDNERTFAYLHNDPFFAFGLRFGSFLGRRSLEEEGEVEEDECRDGRQIGRNQFPPKKIHTRLGRGRASTAWFIFLCYLSETVNKSLASLLRLFRLQPFPLNCCSFRRCADT